MIEYMKYVNYCDRVALHTCIEFTCKSTLKL